MCLDMFRIRKESAVSFRFQMVEKNAFPPQNPEGGAFAAGRTWRIQGVPALRCEFMSAQTAAKTQRFFHKFKFRPFVGSAGGHDLKGLAHGGGRKVNTKAVSYAQKRQSGGAVSDQFFLRDVHHACHKGEFMHGMHL